jgi:hypothetical protein
MFFSAAAIVDVFVDGRPVTDSLRVNAPGAMVRQRRSRELLQMSLKDGSWAPQR